MNKLYNICLTLISIIMTLCITYASIYFNSRAVLWFLLLPTYMCELLIFYGGDKK